MIKRTVLSQGRKMLLPFFIVATILQLVHCDTCNVNDDARKYCGWQGIKPEVCESNGCCWRNSSTHGVPWCFYDSATAAKLKTEKACEHKSPVVLQCNETERISIHDVFYGRNNDDNSCHHNGPITCFNPNATEIVRNMCKNNSTCTVSPRGNFWKFNRTCDDLNAQLVVHYICIQRAPTSIAIHSVTTTGTLSKSHTRTAVTSTITSTKTITVSIYTSSPTSTTIKGTSSKGSPTISHTRTLVASTITSRKKITVSIDPSVPCNAVSPSTTQIATCPEVKALSLEVKRKDNIIIGLSVILAIMSLAGLSFIVLSCRAKNVLGHKFKEERNDEARMEPIKASNVVENKAYEASNTYDELGLQNENPFYEST